MNRVVFSSASAEWGTPKSVYDKLDAEFRFDFDPCPLGGSIDGSARLLNSWSGKRVFCNPPYGPDLRKFLKCWRDADLAVYLIPARTDTRWFHEIVLPFAKEIRFIKGRLKFGDCNQSAPFPSMVVVFEAHRMTNADLAVLGEQDNCKELALQSPAVYRETVGI